MNFLLTFDHFQMTLILAGLPKQYQDAAKNYIQQTIRNNVSGKFRSF